MAVRLSVGDWEALSRRVSGRSEIAVKASRASEPAWAGYPEPRLCLRCGKRVTLSQALQAHTDLESGERWVRHLAAVDCEALR